jgi:hypothetical protein
MFEVIGILVVAWIGYSILRGILRGMSTARSQEFGKEARRISTVELCVPNSYYNHMVTTKMEAIKDTALHLRDNYEDFKGCSWPRLLALTIYGEYHQECEKWQYDPIRQQLFQAIRISPQDISEELERDAESVIYASR